MNEFAAAADRSLAVIDVETADVAMLIWLGRLCERAGMQERAGELFARVTQTDPSNPDAWIWLARWQVVEEEKKAAEETIFARFDRGRRSGWRISATSRGRSEDSGSQPASAGRRVQDDSLFVEVRQEFGALRFQFGIILQQCPERITPCLDRADLEGRIWA